MKKLALLFCLPLFFFACDKDKISEDDIKYCEYQQFDMTENADRHVVRLPVREIVKEGNITVYEDYLYVVEPMMGIHLIFNADPKNPVNYGFIQVPGITNCSLSDGFLYADMGYHLAVMEIVDGIPEVRNIVEYALLPYRDTNGNHYFNEENPYILSAPTGNFKYIDEEDDRAESYSFEENGKMYIRDYYGCFEGPRFTVDFANETSADASGGSTSVSGSMASFAINHTHLFLINRGKVVSYNIKDRVNPVKDSEVELAWNLETLFPYKQYLFVGTSSGMHILDAQNPSSLSHISSLEHVLSCDPVVAHENRAYVTLRSGNWCQGIDNQLDIIDITDIQNPSLIKSVGMTNPKGLGISSEKQLYICDSKSGVRIINAKHEQDIENAQMNTINLDAHDVIVLSDKHVIVRSEEGLYQYDCSDPYNVQLLSVIQ